MSADFSHEQLQETAQRTANAYAKIANKYMGCNLPIPVPMTFELQNVAPKASGRASGDMSIEINMILFEDNVEYILNDTIPHEIGHLAQFDKFNHKGVDTHGHGVEWQEVMRRLGKTPHKFHKLDVSRAIAHYKENKKKKPRKGEE